MVGVGSIVFANNQTSIIFAYGNFCCAVIIVPRLWLIWKGQHDVHFVAIKAAKETIKSKQQ